jgi:hypothetical protein
MMPGHQSTLRAARALVGAGYGVPPPHLRALLHDLISHTEAYVAKRRPFLQDPHLSAHHKRERLSESVHRKYKDAPPFMGAIISAVSRAGAGLTPENASGLYDQVAHYFTPQRVRAAVDTPADEDLLAFYGTVIQWLPIIAAAVQTVFNALADTPNEEVRSALGPAPQLWVPPQGRLAADELQPLTRAATLDLCRRLADINLTLLLCRCLFQHDPAVFDVVGASASRFLTQAGRPDIDLGALAQSYVRSRT